MLYTYIEQEGKSHQEPQLAAAQGWAVLPLFRLKGLSGGDSALLCILGSEFLSAPSFSPLTDSFCFLIFFRFDCHNLLSSSPHDVSSLTVNTNRLEFILVHIPKRRLVEQIMFMHLETFQLWKRFR